MNNSYLNIIINRNSIANIVKYQVKNMREITIKIDWNKGIFNYVAHFMNVLFYIAKISSTPYMYKLIRHLIINTIFNISITLSLST